MARMMSKVAIVLSVFLTLALAQAVDVNYCTKKAYDVKVKALDIDPYPISKGKKTTFSISAVAGNAISGGKLKIDVSYFGFQIHNEVHDLCEETTCPVTTGDFVVSHSQELPVYTPPGSYKLKMTMLDDKNHELTCITFDFTIGLVASVADI